MRGENESQYNNINPSTEFHVWCDLETDGGGWTTIQRRSQHEKYGDRFEQPLEKYDKGFSEDASSYWIGNENIYVLTNFPNNKQVLRIELTKNKGEKPTVLNYGKFQVGPKSENFKLTIGDYDGPDGGDALKSHNGARFSTRNSKNGESRGSGCYKLQSGGWWFRDYYCSHSNLNGRKFKGRVPDGLNGFGITWYNESDKNSYSYVYYKVEMKIRNADFKFCMGFLTYKILSSTSSV